MGGLWSTAKPQLPDIDPCHLRLFSMGHMSLNGWYFGPSEPLADDYIVVCSRCCGPQDYSAQWRFFPEDRRFELVVTNYWDGAYGVPGVLPGA